METPASNYGKRLMSRMGRVPSLGGWQGADIDLVPPTILKIGRIWNVSILCFFLSLQACTYSTTTVYREKASSHADSLRIIFVGDLLLDRGVRERIEHLGLESLFHPSMDSLFSGSDIVVANLECPATSIEEPINKRYIFRAEPHWLDALADHGVTHLCLANNHSMDQGRAGLVDTERNVFRAGMTPMGYGIDHKTACEPALLADSPRKMYVFSSVQVQSENWTFLPEKPCICEESLSEVGEKVTALKAKEPDALVLVQLHWGAEHTLEPQTAQKQQAHQLIDAGADAIIGHHSHTVQTVERYKGKPIYYGIGNFIFDQRKPINSRGMAVQVVVYGATVEFEDVDFRIESCRPILR